MIIKLILLLIGIIFIYLIKRFITGHKIGVRLGDFEKIYDEAISNFSSKPEAFKKGITVFKQCYPFNKLSSEEWEKINNTFSSLSNPKKPFIEIMLYPSKTALKALKNDKFLEELKSKYA